MRLNPMTPIIDAYRVRSCSLAGCLPLQPFALTAALAVVLFCRRRGSLFHRAEFAFAENV